MAFTAKPLFLVSLLIASGAGAAPARLTDGLEVAEPADVAMHAAPFESLSRERLDRDFPDTTSVLLYKDGRLVFERYFGAGRVGLLNDTRSVTKTLTALIVGRAIADGAIDSAEQSAFSLLPDLAPFRNDGPVKRAITLTDLLTMSSALDCDDFDADNVGNEENMYPLTNWSRWAVDLPVKPHPARASHGRDVPPPSVAS